MLKRMLCAILVVALLLSATGALAEGAAQQVKLRIIDPKYTDETGKTLDLTGLEGVLSYHYMVSEGERAADMTMGVTVEEEEAFSFEWYLNEEYTIFSFDQQKAYGSSLTALPMEVQDLLYSFESFLALVNAVQRGEEQVNFVTGMRDLAFPWQDGEVQALGTTEISFFDEPRQALIRKSVFTPDAFQRMQEKQFGAMGFDAYLIRVLNGEQNDLVGNAEYMVYSVSDNETLWDSTLTRQIEGREMKTRSKYAHRAIGEELYEVRGEITEWYEDMPEEKTTTESVFFARREKDANNAGMITATAVTRDKNGLPMAEMAFHLMPVLEREKWRYDISLTLTLDDSLLATQAALYEDLGELLEQDVFYGSEEEAVEIMDFSYDFTLRGSMSGVGGDSAFEGTMAQKTTSSEAETDFSCGIVLELSPYLDGPVAEASMPELIDIGNMDDAQAGMMAYEMVDAVSHAYVVIQEMPAVKEYMGKTRKIADLAK